MGFSSSEVLRKADPLSLCLFIIATEFWSGGLDHLYSQYPLVQYYSVAPVFFSHLSSADDILIFAN